MGRIRKFLAVVTALIFTTGITALYADDIATQLNNIRKSYAGGAYQTVLRNGFAAMDLVYQKQAQRLIALIPNPEGFAIVETNSSFYFSDQNGILDHSLQVWKTYSNQTAVIRVNADTSQNNVERFLNLARSYDYLNDKGDYRKFVLTNRKSELIYFTEKNDIYIIPALIEANDSVISGVLLKIGVSFPANLKSSEKEKMIQSSAKDFILKINYRDMTNFVK